MRKRQGKLSYRAGRKDRANGSLRCWEVRNVKGTKEGAFLEKGIRKITSITLIYEYSSVEGRESDTSLKIQWYITFTPFLSPAYFLIVCGDEGEEREESLITRVTWPLYINSA